jgi:hypothetical protein
MNDDNASCIADNAWVRRIKLSEIMEALPPSGQTLLRFVVQNKFVPPWFQREQVSSIYCGGAMILITFSQLCWALINCYEECADTAVVGATLSTLRDIRADNGFDHTLRVDVLS